MIFGLTTIDKPTRCWLKPYSPIMGYKVVRFLVLCARDTRNSLYFFCICFFLFPIPHVYTSTMFLAKPYTSENIWNSNFLMKILLYTVNFKYLISTKLSTTTQYWLDGVKNHWGECLAHHINVISAETLSLLWCVFCLNCRRFKPPQSEGRPHPGFWVWLPL